MMGEFNPKDPNYFATASLDKTVRVWSLGQSTPNFSLEGHTQGVNCVSYYTGSDQPYLLSGSDDQTIKLWDYQTKACVATLTGHTNNVAAVCFHPVIPVFVSASEDGTVRMWNNTTFRCETTLNYALERAWTLRTRPNKHELAIGFDEGSVVLKIGSDEPIISMDRVGKLVRAQGNDVMKGNMKGLEYVDPSSHLVLCVPCACVDAFSVLCVRYEPFSKLFSIFLWFCFVSPPRLTHSQSHFHFPQFHRW